MAYKKMKLYADCGDTWVTINVEGNNRDTLTPGEFKELRKHLADRLMEAMPGKYFWPHLSDIEVTTPRK